MNNTLFKKLNEQMQLNIIYKNQPSPSEKIDDSIIFEGYIDEINNLLTEEENKWLSKEYLEYLKNADAWQRNHDMKNADVKKHHLFKRYKERAVEQPSDEKEKHEPAKKEEKKEATTQNEKAAAQAEYMQEYTDLNNDIADSAKALKTAIKEKQAKKDEYKPNSDSLADAYDEVDYGFKCLDDINRAPAYSSLRLSLKKRDLKDIKLIEFKEFKRLFPEIVSSSAK